MSDLPNRRAQLLADTLHGDWAGGPAAGMARRAAAHARNRRAVKTAVLTFAAAAALGAMVFVSNQKHGPMASPPAPAAHLGYEIISDDELVAQVHDRPLLVLTEKNGSKKIVLLDR